MIDEYEIRWERFSDQLSVAFGDIAVSDQLSEDTLDKLQYAAVNVFREHLDSILRQQPIPAAERRGLTLQ